MTVAITTSNPMIERARILLEEEQFLDSHYFRRLRDGSMSHQSFLRSQGQFYHAVTYFARPMASLMARIPEPADRLTILHNVVEEHGEFNIGNFHQSTFRRFLNLLNQADLEPPSPGAAVLSFNTLLGGVCSLMEVPTAIACMGIIEYAFAHASACLGHEVVAQGWIRSDDLVHYNLHAALDLEHAEEFFELIAADWMHRRHLVEQGMQIGLYAFRRLYDDLER